MSNPKAEFSFEIEPGYLTMAEAWSDVFTQDPTGAYLLNPAQALEHIATAEAQALEELRGDKDRLTGIKSCACRSVLMSSLEGKHA